MKIAKLFTKGSSEEIIRSTYKTTEKQDSSTVGNLDKDNRLVQIALSKFRKVSLGKGNKPMADYLKEVASTKGNYRSRSNEIIRAVTYAFDYVFLSHLTINKHKDYKATVAPVFLDTYKILNDKRWTRAFNKAYEYHSKQKKISPLESMMVIYSMMSMGLETMTYFLNKYETELSSKDVGRILNAYREFGNENHSFVSSVVRPLIYVVEYMKTVKDPEKLVTDMIKSEKEGIADAEMSKESFQDHGFEHSSIIPQSIKDKVEYSEESVLAAGTIVLVVLLVSFVLGIIPFIRHMIYYFQYCKVNIAANIREDIEVLTTNIGFLEDQRDASNDPREKERLSIIIEKQYEAVERFRIKEEKIRGTYVSAERESIVEETADENSVESSKVEDDGDFFL